MKIVKVSDGPWGEPKGGTSPDPTSAWDTNSQERGKDRETERASWAADGTDATEIQSDFYSLCDGFSIMDGSANFLKYESETYQSNSQIFTLASSLSKTCFQHTAVGT